MPQIVPGRRLNSHQRRERQKRKQYEKERPELGGFVWQAVLIGLLGCLFCAGKGWEEKVENAKVNPEDKEKDGGDGGEGERRHHHRHVRGRSRRSRSRTGSDEGSDGRGYRERVEDGSAYGGYGDDRVTYIPGTEERYRGNDNRLRRYDVESQEVYEVDESPAPRRRRVRREESFD